MANKQEVEDMEKAIQKIEENAKKEKKDKKEKKEKKDKDTKEKKDKDKEDKKDKDKEKEKEKDKKEKNNGPTFNDLAPEYQWDPSLDPDHIFDGEKKLIKEVRKSCKQAEKESDKFILIFLIARRHDVKTCVELLGKFYELQSTYGYNSVSPPSLTYNEFLQQRLRCLPILQPSGFRDVHGRMLRYFFLGMSDPEQRDYDTFYTFLFWQTYFFLQFEPINAWRNGVVTVTDMTDFGWKNVDMSSKSRQQFKSAQGCFPFRMRAMVVVNGGGMVNTMIRIFKLVAPKKMVDRVSQMDASKLKELIPPHYLLKRYEGGECNADFDAFFDGVLEKEQILYENGIWKKPDGAEETTTN